MPSPAPLPGAFPAVPGVTRRLLCLVYEALLLTAVVFAATVLVLVLFHALDLTLPRPALQLYVLVVCGLYFVPQWRAGQTLPMKTWRIRVIDRNGGPLTRRAAVMRYVLAGLSMAALGLGFLWAYWDRDRQFLHDRLAGSRLVWHRE